MLNEIAHFLLIVSFVLALLQSTIPVIGAHKNNFGMMNFARSAAVIQFVLILLCFLVLVQAFATSDFSLRVVALNSHSLKPMIYKLSGTWGNHEGSMLLWVLILALFGAFVSVFGKSLSDRFRALALAVQGIIGVAFISFLLFSSNPFTRLKNPPFDGQGLNPLLQDVGLALHPPFLYVGYVGLSIAFSFAVASLLESKVDSTWARWVRPWTLVAWIFLTIGIALGSWWAYYELGWGGVWAWDPVENASFMPWLLAVALLHSALVLEKRESLKSWTVLLSILAFGFSLIGTFIVRSGLLTSVHAFANDPDRGIFILTIIGFLVGGALLLFAYRSPVLKETALFSSVSRESSIIINNVLLVLSAFVVFIGTVWPLVAELVFNRQLSVGPPFFNKAFIPFVIALGLFLPIGATTPWKRANFWKTIYKLRMPFILAISVSGLLWCIQSDNSLQAPIGLMLGSWIISGVLMEILGRLGFKKNPLQVFSIPRSEFAKLLAHSGFGITIFSIAAMSAWTQEDIRVVSVKEKWQLGYFDLQLDSVNEKLGPNYISIVAKVTASKGTEDAVELYPEKRFYPVAGIGTTEAAIAYGFARDIYIVLGAEQGDNSWVVKSYIKPFVNWIWFGALLMALGGLFSLSDRKFRQALSGKK